MAYSALTDKTSADTNSATDINQLNENIKQVVDSGSADAPTVSLNDLDTEVSSLTTTVNQNTPAGVIHPYGGLSAPTGFLLCDGSAISRTTYSTLYGVITTSKGSVTISQANPGIVTLNGHGLITGDCIELTTTGALPTGLSVNTNYYVYYENANTFSLASSLANAVAGTRIQTTSAGSGTHTLRYCPFGISTSTNFLLPDLRNVFLRGANTASRTISAQASISYDALSQGVLENDRMQGFQVGTHNDATGARDYWMSGGARDFTNSVAADANSVQIYAKTGNQGTNPFHAMNDGTNGEPRSGTTTRPQSIGINFIIKY